MISRTVARRYVRAIFELAEEQDKLETVGRQIGELNALIGGHEELSSIFANPAIPAQTKQKIFAELEPQLEIDPLCANFMKLLIRKGRINYLELILSEYRKLERERRGIVVVNVSTARPLSETLQQQLRRKLAEVSGKEVEIKTTEEPELIGGLVARIGGTIYDGSVARQLELVQQRLKQE